MHPDPEHPHVPEPEPNPLRAAMKAEEFDKVSEEDQTNLDLRLDLSTARRPGRDVR